MYSRSTCRTYYAIYINTIYIKYDVLCFLTYISCVQDLCLKQQKQKLRCTYTHMYTVLIINGKFLFGFEITGAARRRRCRLLYTHHTIKMKSTRAPSKVIRASWRWDMNKYALCNNIYVCIVCIVCVVCVCCRQTMPRVQWHNFYAQHWTLHGTASTLTCKSTISQAINLSCAFYGVFSIRRCSIYFYI